MTAWQPRDAGRMAYVWALEGVYRLTRHPRVTRANLGIPVGSSRVPGAICATGAYLLTYRGGVSARV